MGYGSFTKPLKTPNKFGAIDNVGNLRKQKLREQANILKDKGDTEGLQKMIDQEEHHKDLMSQAARNRRSRRPNSPDKLSDERQMEYLKEGIGTNNPKNYN